MASLLIYGDVLRDEEVIPSQRQPILSDLDLAQVAAKLASMKGNIVASKQIIQNTFQNYLNEEEQLTGNIFAQFC